MAIKPLQILQWNVGKRREAQLSLLNDQQTNNFDFLLLAEPFRFTLEGQNQPTVPQHHYWEAVLPTKWVRTAYQPFNFRSMIYVNKRFKFQQMPIPSSDLTAVLIKQNQESLLIISAYVEYNQNSAQCKRILEQSLQHVRTTLQKACQDNPSTRLVLARDFNRHDSLWGGQGASWRRQGEGEPILQFMAEHQLWSALPQGTTTYSNDSTSKESTIDLMLVPSLFRPMIISCQTYGIDHGSDHRAISLKLNGYSQL